MAFGSVCIGCDKANQTGMMEPNDRSFSCLDSMPVASAKEGRPIAAFYFRDSREDPRKAVSVVWAIWEDGTMIWSSDSMYGGPPYSKGIIKSSDLEEGLRALKGVFESDKRAAHVGVDSKYHVLVATNGMKCLHLVSWHEVFEENPNLVATDSGIEPLTGRSRAEVLKEQSDEYRAFRSLWETVRGKLGELAPNEGTTVESLKFTLTAKGTMKN
jgi:hypothetical protein